MATHQEDLRWFETFAKGLQHQRLAERPVAYFCAEYALEPDMRTYAGGLGVLAGDVVREAGDRGVPMVAVGIFYREGYLCETPPGQDGKSPDICLQVHPEDYALEAVKDAAGERLVVRVPIQDRDVHIQVWKWAKAPVPVYLLDTDLEANAPGDRGITHRLYVGDKETRLKQEIILGIGGLRVLEALDIHPSLYHLNEGHSAMLALELVRHEMQERRLGFDEAKQFARRRAVLTNHTLVPAGQELFSNDLVSVMLAKYAEELQVPVSDLVRLGLVQESSVFSMTMLAFRMTGIINSVSRLHARKAKELWTDHPMAPVTNGVHLPTWDRLREDGDAPAVWEAHRARKRELLDAVRARAGRTWDEGHLLLGWARRLVSYKRPLAILEDAKRFAAIARNAERPVRIVFSGYPHPSDEEGAKMLRRLRELVDGELKDVAAYLPEYGMDEAMELVAGCDVWLNTPVVGFEACGTSGMKAALNGVLPFTTRDGWIDEVDLLGIGWFIDSNRVTDDALDLLEKQVAPLYYARNAAGIPEGWIENMKNARALVRDRFSATRMLREYLETLYF